MRCKDICHFGSRRTRLVGVQVLDAGIDANVNVLIDVAGVVTVQLKSGPDWRAQPVLHSQPIKISYYIRKGSPVLLRTRGKGYQAVIKLPLPVGR